jgi:hypothetical protein
MASGAAGLKKSSVHVVDALGASPLMEVIYVLRAEIKAIAELLFDLCKGSVGGVRFYCNSVSAAHGIKAPDEFGIRFPGFRCRHFFNAITVPESP